MGSNAIFEVLGVGYLNFNALTYRLDWKQGFTECSALSLEISIQILR